MPASVDSSKVLCNVSVRDVHCDPRIVAHVKRRRSERDTSVAPSCSATKTVAAARNAKAPAFVANVNPCEHRIMSDMDKLAYSHLPLGIRKRKEEWFSMTFEVCVDKANAERCLKELEIFATDERESQKRVDKARRTRDFLKQFIAYSQKYATLKSDEGGVQVWCLERTTYSLRNAAGRWYANASLASQSDDERERDKIRSLSVQCCPKIVRSILFGYRDHDVDISNAHPTIMQGLAAQLRRPTPMLDDYVNFRSRPGGVYCTDGWIMDVVQFHGIAETYPGRQKECAKELFLRLMYGGKYESWCNDHLDAKSNVNFHPQVQLLAKEIADIHDMVLRCDEWAEFCSFHRQRIKSEDAQANVKQDFYDLEGSLRRERPIVPRIVALVLQTIEADMLQVVMKVFVERGHSISAIIHDGFHVNGKQLDDESYMRNLLDEAERRVKATMNYDIVVEEKPFYGLHTRPVKLDV